MYVRFPGQAFPVSADMGVHRDVGLDTGVASIWWFPITNSLY